MKVALVGNGQVAKALLEIIDQERYSLLSYDRNSDFYSVPTNKDIDIVIDLLGHNDEALYISRKIIKESLDNNKIVITPNKKLMRSYGVELCDHAKNTNGHLYINSLVASSEYFKDYPAYLSIYNYKEMNTSTDIFRYRGAGPQETAQSINNELEKIWKIKNEK